MLFLTAPVCALLESNQTGLCTPLTVPCPRAYIPPPFFKDFEINRNAIQMVKKLGSGAFGDVWEAKMSNVFDVAVKCLKVCCLGFGWLAIAQCTNTRIPQEKSSIEHLLRTRLRC